MNITETTVRELISDQFPHWAGLSLRFLDAGWDNRTFRLGEDKSVRLPSAECYVAQVDKEHRWLTELAPHLPLPIPEPLAMGNPGSGYPWHWSIYRWIEGESAFVAQIDDRSEFAVTLARFLTALHQIDVKDGPPPGPHNFFRGAPLSTYDPETRRAIESLEGRIDTHAVSSAWEAGLDAMWNGPPVWVHGDVAPGNLLVEKGRLSAVIDFGCSGVGDPACDLAMAWTFFSGESREAFRDALPLDDATWDRARGWALWKALITAAEHGDSSSRQAADAQLTIDAVLADRT